MLLLLLLSLSLNQKVCGSPVDSLATITVFVESHAYSTKDYESREQQEDKYDYAAADDEEASLEGSGQQTLEDKQPEEASHEGSGQQTRDGKQPDADITSTIYMNIGCIFGFLIVALIVILIIKYWMMPNAQGTYIVAECTEK